MARGPGPPLTPAEEAQLAGYERKLRRWFSTSALVGVWLAALVVFIFWVVLLKWMVQR